MMINRGSTAKLTPYVVRSNEAGCRCDDGARGVGCGEEVGTGFGCAMLATHNRINEVMDKTIFFMGTLTPITALLFCFGRFQRCYADAKQMPGRTKFQGLTGLLVRFRARNSEDVTG